MECNLLVLQVLPTRLPGLRQRDVRRRVAHKVNLIGGPLPSKHEINGALVELSQKGLVKSKLLHEPDDGFRYRVYWREQAYQPNNGARPATPKLQAVL